MRFPIKIRLAHNADKNARFHQAWNFTDKFFRLVQWVAFIAVIKYASDKSHSLILNIFELCLEMILVWTVWLMAEAKYEIRVHNVNEKLKLHRELFFLSSSLFLVLSLTAIHFFIIRLVEIFITSTHL